MIIPLSERIERLTDWYNMKNDRPLLGFYMGSQYPLHRFEAAKKLPDGIVKPEDIIVEDYLDDFDKLYTMHEQAGGDLIWSAGPFWGLPWIEAALGCEIMADLTTGSTRAKQIEGFADNPVIPEFSPENPWVKKMLEFIPAAEKRSAGRYPIANTLMRGISDLLATIYGGEKFIFRMLEAPDEIKMVADKLADFWIDFGKCLLEHLPMFEGGTGSFFYNVWLPGKAIWTQEDSSALLSPDLYEKFIYPGVCRTAEAFEPIVIHLHPSMFVPVDYLMKTKIDVIELHIDKGGATAEDLYDTHIKILKGKPLIIWGDITEDDLNFICNKLPYEGLLISMVADSSQQAHRFYEKAEKIWTQRNAH